MAHYEVHRLVDDRWLLDAVFVEKLSAIEEAKSAMARARALVAVRVLRVEEQAGGFVEWVVYYNSTADEIETVATRRRRRRLSQRLRSVPRSVIARARRLAEPSGRPPAWLVLGLLVLATTLILSTHRPPSPRKTWIFDRPEAQLPHTVRNPLTGESSQ
jgi:hypothetical protein